MAKKTEQIDRRKQPQFGFRCEFEEGDLLEHAAAQEGFSSVSQWVKDLAIRRAGFINESIKNGTFVEVHGRTIPSSEVPGTDANECRLLNAEKVLNSLTRTLDDEKRIAAWLAVVQSTGTEPQKTRAHTHTLRMHHDAHEIYDHLCTVYDVGSD